MYRLGGCLLIMMDIKGKGYLKVVPKKKQDLTKFFDHADVGMNIEDWNEFERGFYNEIYSYDKGFDDLVGITRVPLIMER